MSSFAARGGHASVPYEIVVRGAVPEQLGGPLQNLSVEIDGDLSVLTGDMVDQSQLQGVLATLAELGFELVRVNPC